MSLLRICLLTTAVILAGLPSPVDAAAKNPPAKAFCKNGTEACPSDFVCSFRPLKKGSQCKCCRDAPER